MTKEVACATDSFRIRSDSDDELVAHVQQHAVEAHKANFSREQVLAIAKTVQVATA